MTIDEPESVSNEENPADPAQNCAPGCDCGKAGRGGKSKSIVAIGVLVVAAVLLARGLMTADGASAGQDGDSFGTIVTPDAAGTASTDAGGDAVQSSLWGGTLEALGDLNSVAGAYGSVLVYLPSAGGSDESIRGEIEAAADKSQAQGMSLGLFILSAESEDYFAIAGQAPVPCVMALVRGGGSVVVSGDITEAKLLAAVVAASRPSTCGPAGCGPSSSC